MQAGIGACYLFSNFSLDCGYFIYKLSGYVSPILLIILSADVDSNSITS